MTKWPNYALSMKAILENGYDKDVCTGWSEQIEQMLALLKLLPAKTTKNPKSPVLPFSKAIEKLITHSEVCNFS